MYSIVAMDVMICLELMCCVRVLHVAVLKAPMIARMHDLVLWLRLMVASTTITRCTSKPRGGIAPRSLMAGPPARAHATCARRPAVERCNNNPCESLPLMTQQRRHRRMRAGHMGEPEALVRCAGGGIAARASTHSPMSHRS